MGSRGVGGVSGGEGGMEGEVEGIRKWMGERGKWRKGGNGGRREGEMWRIG